MGGSPQPQNVREGPCRRVPQLCVELLQHHLDLLDLLRGDLGVLLVHCEDLTGALDVLGLEVGDLLQVLPPNVLGAGAPPGC